MFLSLYNLIRPREHRGWDREAEGLGGLQIFGGLKTIGLMRQTRHRGRRRVGWMFVFGLAVYNLVRIRNLTEQAT